MRKENIREENLRLSPKQTPKQNVKTLFGKKNNWYLVGYRVYKIKNMIN